MLFDMSSRDQMRVADADREQAATRVREALEEGRLTLEELDQRLQQVYAAQTFGDLDQLLSDLPTAVPAEQSQVLPASRGPVPASRHEPNPRLPTWLAYSWRLWFLAVAINLVVWFLVSVSTGGVVYFWPMWVAGPWAAVNVALVVVFPPRRREQ